MAVLVVLLSINPVVGQVNALFPDKYDLSNRHGFKCSNCNALYFVGGFDRKFY